MKFLRCAPAVLTLAGGAILVLSLESDAYLLTGASLDLGQRDFRVFDNFADPEANDNTTPDPAFPGHTGAVLAIWKASVEWGSELHGDGSGDPHQPGDLGSGGANFDASFQGLADGPGSIEGNVHSAITCGSAGLVAYFEQPSGGGWRIRYCEEICWDDGPGVVTSPGCYDLQGVATRMVGHVLGLGSSSVPGSTMYTGGGPGSGVSLRSIEADDVAGIQAVYGVASATKPHVESATVVGSQVTIVGAHFAISGNEVWFTRAAPGGDGTPEKVTGVSSDGTSLTVAIPPLAGAGDVLVRVPGAGGDALSNAYPLEPCPAPVAYCQTAPNSAGPGALMAWSGSTSFAANDFVLECAGAPPNRNGLFFHGAGPVLAPFGDGFRCASGPFCRGPVISVDGAGDASHPLDLDDPPSPGCTLGPGSAAYFQFWYRDPAFGAAGFNLSDGLRVSFCP